MKCLICGWSSMIQGHDKKIDYQYKGHHTQLLVRGDWCPDCEEIVLNDVESAIMEKKTSDFKRQVNSQTGNPGFILAVRKKLGLNQKQAGEIFGGGANAFSRYELGQTTPPQTLIQLFRLLDNDPSRFKEL